MLCCIRLHLQHDKDNTRHLKFERWLDLPIIPNEFEFGGQTYQVAWRDSKQTVTRYIDGNKPYYLVFLRIGTYHGENDDAEANTLIKEGWTHTTYKNPTFDGKTITRIGTYQHTYLITLETMDITANEIKLKDLIQQQYKVKEIQHYNSTH